MIKNILRKFIPYEIVAMLRNYKILSVQYGQYKTMRKWECIDKENNPIPWYSYPAIEFIRQLDFSRKMILEYGSGNSTIFWAQHCEKVVYHSKIKTSGIKKSKKNYQIMWNIYC